MKNERKLVVLYCADNRSFVGPNGWTKRPSQCCWFSVTMAERHPLRSECSILPFSIAYNKWLEGVDQ